MAKQRPSEDPCTIYFENVSFVETSGDMLPMQLPRCRVWYHNHKARVSE